MKEGAPPDDLRCNRSDGKQWRCKRPAMDGKKMCEVHNLQLSLRQHRQKVPDSLKLVRTPNHNKDSRENGEFRARKSQNSTKKRKRVMGESEAVDEAVKKMKLKRGDFQLDLIRMMLKREVEKKNKSKNPKKNSSKVQENKTEHDFESDGDSEGELRRVLPNGVMAISSFLPNKDNADASCDHEVGVKTVSVVRRRFRSKNIEPLPLCSTQVVSYEVNSGKRKSCHWCGIKGSSSLISCSSCKSASFCLDCVKERHIGSREEVEQECIVCRGTCGCQACSTVKSRDAECKNFLRNSNKVERVLHLHYLICMLLPVLKQINKDQAVGLKQEKKVKGQPVYELEVQRADSVYNDRHCKNSEMHFSHRTVDGKCQDEKNSHEMLFEGETLNGNALVRCTHMEVGTRENGVLVASNLFPSISTKKLEKTAEEIVSSYELPETLDKVSRCSLCTGLDNEANGTKQLQEASRRNDSDDNFLFHPTVLDTHNDKLEHFQRHWAQGHPVIVQDVVQNVSGLRWDPVALFCSYLKRTTKESWNDELNKDTDHLDWFEVEIGIKQLFVGSLRRHSEANGSCQEKLKLKGWLSSRLFQEQFPTLYSEIIDNLPLPHYMDPKSGILNIAANPPDNLQKSDFGPCVLISYSSGEEFVQADLLTELCSGFNDVVNILVHATETPVSTKQLYRIQKLMKKQKAQNQMERKEMKSKTSLLCKNSHQLGFENSQGNKNHRHGRGMKNSGLADEIFDASQKGEDTSHPETDWSESSASSGSESSKLSPGSKRSTDRFENGELPVDQRQNCHDFREEESLDRSCGALWDVFRRQDVPKLVEYIRKHSHELKHSCSSSKHVAHPFLDQSFFLDAYHKMRLKEEFEIEPWSFEQHVGEAVIIPSGCPYQIRRLKSCVNVVLKFLSPENVSECFQRSSELHLLPADHNPIDYKFKVQQMAINSISAAIDEIRGLTTSD